MRVGVSSSRGAVAVVGLVAALVAVAVTSPLRLGAVAHRATAPGPVLSATASLRAASPASAAKSAPARPKSPSSLQGDGPADAISREFTLFSGGASSETEDAISREFTLFSGGASSDPEDAISREFTLFSGGASSETEDAISREFTLFSGGASSETEDAISREFTLFSGAPSSDAIDAISREFTVRTVDASDLPIDAIAREFVVAILDNVPPKTEIVVGPREGGQIAPGPVNFQWRGFDNVTPSGALLYQFRMNKGLWSDWSTTTSTTTASLPPSIYVFEVRARDAGGNVQDPPTARTFAVDVTPPQIVEIGVRDIAWNAATIYWRTNEISRGTVRYGLQATNDFRFEEESEPELRMYHEVRIESLSSITPYRYKVELVDEAGNTSTSQTLSFTTAPLYDLSVRPEDITFSTPFPADNELITMSALVRNSGDVPLVALVDFYDYRTDTGPVLIGTRQVELDPYTPPTLVTSPSFVVRQRVHRPYVQIRTTQDDLPLNNRADKTLYVNAQSYRLTFTVPTLHTWPGDVQQFVVNVTNTGSQPQTISDARVQGVSFASRVSSLPVEPLAPGETTQVLFQLDTPAGQTPGPLGGFVVIEGRENYTQPVAVMVHSGPVAQLLVRLVNERTGEGIVNGIVVIGNDPRIYGTGAGGYVIGTGGNPMSVAVPIGNAVVYGYASNYLPRAGSVQIVAGSNSLTIRLEEGDAFSIQQITTTPLTAAQIAERGVNLEDPENFWVYEFVLYLEIGAVRLPDVIVPTTPGYSSGYTFGGGESGGGGGGGVTFKIDAHFTENTSTWIIIPGQVRILRQFWDATVTIQNRALGFEVRDAEATLSVPVGLSLPPLFGAPQPTTVQLGTIPGGEFRQASWVVRGDYPGTYRLTGHATGNLMLGGTPIPVNSTLQSGEIEVATPSVEITFTAPDAVQANQPFNLGIHVRNTSTIDLEFVQVALRADRLTNCTVTSSPTVDLGAILRNETKTALFTLTSPFTGVVVNPYLIVTAPPVEPPVTVVPGFIRILRVDDDDPANPVIRFECDDADAVTARIAGRNFNLGALAEGEHEVTLTNMHTVSPGEYQLEIEGLFDGIRLADIARFDTRFIDAPSSSGSTSFTVGGTSRSMDYSGSLLVRRWDWNIPGDTYTRLVVGTTTTFTTNLQSPFRLSRPRLVIEPPATGAIGGPFECLSGGLVLPGGFLSFKCVFQNATVFASPGAVFRGNLSGHTSGTPWLFSGSSLFQFEMTVP